MTKFENSSKALNLLVIGQVRPISLQPFKPYYIGKDVLCCSLLGNKNLGEICLQEHNLVITLPL